MTGSHWTPPRIADERRLTLLEAHADLALDQQHDLFGAVEAKAGLYMAVASVLMAGSAALLPDEVLPQLRSAPSWVGALFSLGTAGSAVTGVWVVIEAIGAIRVGRSHVRDTDARAVFAVFQDPRPDLREQLVNRVFDAAHAMRLEIRKKADHLETAESLLYGFVGFQVLFAGALAVLTLS